MPSIPYIAHLLGVASLAFEYGSDKALLHDAVEDQGGIDAWSQFVDPSVLRY
jgi:(p)ppGpp synthase/HD superfamily hydrolase